MKQKNIYKIILLFAMLLSVSPANVQALNVLPAPPADMFQLPWEQGLSWVAYDGFDNGTRRSPTSPHNFNVGGAVDFAPHAGMVVGENTSTFWVTAAADGVVRTVSSCHIVIDHGSGWTTEYWHLANIQVHVSDVVSRNQKLAVIADNVSVRVCTGNEHPGPHLHFVMRPNMKETKFAGWTINFNSSTNITTYTKNGQTVNKYEPILNVMDPSGTPTPTRTPTPTVTLTPTYTATSTNTPTPTFTQTNTSTPTITNTPALTNTPSPTPTNSLVPSNTATPTSTTIFTNTPTPTGTLAFTNTATPTGPSAFTNTPTSTGTSVFTNTPTPTGTSVFTNTPTSTGTSAVTNTPTPTSTSVFTNTPTSTAASVLTNTPTPTGTSAPTNTPTPTGTSSPTGPYVLTDVTQPNLVIGQSSPVTVSLNNVPVEGYVSAEFTCTYNASLASAGSITVGSLFGAGPVVAINGPQNGSFILAMVGINGNKATTSGAVFTFNITALQAGQTAVNCTARVSKGQSIYENIAFIGDALTITSSITPTPTPTSTPAGPLPPVLAGQVLASKPVTIRLYNPDTTLAATIPANPDGTFNLNATAGSYTIVASAVGYLNAQGPVTLTNGVTTTMPTINLIPGDVDGNGTINLLDALTIGMNYNGATPAAADLNNDGIINVLDLQMLAAHYGQSGALVWQ